MSRTFHHRREERKPKRSRDLPREIVSPGPSATAGQTPASAPRLLAKGIVNGYLYLLDEALLSPPQHLLVSAEEYTGRELVRRILGARRRTSKRGPLALQTLLEHGMRRVIPAACWRREGNGWVVDAPASTEGLFAASERLIDDDAWVDGYILAVDAGRRAPGFDYYVVPEAIDAETGRNHFAEALAMLTTQDAEDAATGRARARRMAEQIGRRIIDSGGRRCIARVSLSIGRDQQVDYEEHVPLGVGGDYELFELAEQYLPQRYYRGQW